MNILITGASRGLGLSMLEQAVERGHHVFAIIRNEAGRAHVERLINAEARSLVTYIILDVRDEQQIQLAAQELSDNNIELDVIINSAAVLLGRQTAITALDFAELRDSFEVNLFGAMAIIKYFLPKLKRDGGKILNISSEAGSITNAYAGDYPYSLSKCALNIFSEQLSRDLKKEGITVWSIHPGWMRTDMGGPHAALDATESAQAIIDIADGTKLVNSTQSFINYNGEPMAI